VWVGVSPPHLVGVRTPVYFIIKVKMQGFMHFNCEKILLWPKTGRGGLNRLLGAEDVKRNGG